MENEIVKQPPVKSVDGVLPVQPPQQPAQQVSEVQPNAPNEQMPESDRTLPEDQVAKEQVSSVKKTGSKKPVGVILFALFVFVCLASVAVFLGLQQSNSYDLFFGLTVS